MDILKTTYKNQNITDNYLVKFCIIQRDPKLWQVWLLIMIPRFNWNNMKVLLLFQFDHLIPVFFLHIVYCIYFLQNWIISYAR